MTKDDLIWVVVRSTGFILLLHAVLYVPQIISAIAWIAYLGEWGTISSEGHRVSVGLPQLVSSVAFFVFEGVLGLYFLRSAALVHRFISFVGPERSNSAPQADVREASHAGEPSQPRAAGRER